MPEKCEMLESCGFFLDFRGNSEVLKQGWIKAFCEDRVKSERCKRKIIKNQTGKPPADNMAPTGAMLLE